jgi:hypothetical protein
MAPVMTEGAVHGVADMAAGLGHHVSGLATRIRHDVARCAAGLGDVMTGFSHGIGADRGCSEAGEGRKQNEGRRFQGALLSMRCLLLNAQGRAWLRHPANIATFPARRAVAA